MNRAYCTTTSNTLVVVTFTVAKRIQGMTTDLLSVYPYFFSCTGGTLLGIWYYIYTLRVNILCFACKTTTLHLLLHRIREGLLTMPCPSFFRLVHGFTSSGMLESQYQGFAEAAEPGNVGDKYIDFGELLI